MDLNEEQRAAFERIQAGHNIFLTGPAGSGKSFLIQHIVQWSQTVDKSLAVTAMTGCAALLLGPEAKTLHSWAGVGLARESAEILVKMIRRNRKSVARWKTTSILIVDEISMMTPEFFEKLDAIGRTLRRNMEPWGGIQLILCGDFFQLPPVIRGISGEMSHDGGRFAFESPVWKASRLQPAVLTRIERQTGVEFQKLLNECRVGKPSAETIALLKTRQGLDWKSQQIRPTLLFSNNATVDKVNQTNLDALDTERRVYEVRTRIVKALKKDDLDMDMEEPTGDQLDRFVARLDKDANYVQRLELRVGCQVMLLANLDIERGLVNGSRGIVTGFTSDNSPLVKFIGLDAIPIKYREWKSPDHALVCREQIPLRVAYAITIHKCQGATLDCALVDIGSSTFECGQAYVALSRVRNIESLYIWNLNPARIQAHSTVIAFYETLQSMPLTSAPMEPTAFGIELVDDAWRTVVQTWAETVSGKDCLVKVEEASKTVSPEPQYRLHALQMTPLKSVKVVLLGQEPYRAVDQAHGLSFSVRNGIVPPMLRSIRKEMLADLALAETAWPNSIGDLTPWARQGVLLLNMSLTTGDGTSHKMFGWESLTTKLIESVIRAHAADPLVFLVWGVNVKNMIKKIKRESNHVVIEAGSPLTKEFSGSKPFTKANTYLVAHGAEPIRWELA